GGIQAGMANGAPLIVRVTFRPTPSISLPQHSVDLAAMENTDIAIQGRHDACIALRGLAAAEAALLIAILDAFTEEA
ncbi:MAG: chorismate synthase, partial [Clostridia bacterium]|nr:chorismate synthase [Clostridia bacterium]